MPRYHHRILSKRKTPKLACEQCLWIAFPYHFSLQTYPRHSLIIQELLLLFPTPFQVDKEQYDAETDGTQCRQEVERSGIVVRGHGINDSAGDDGTDERGGFADYVEEGEEEELLAAGCDLGDLRMPQG